jgi:multidrug efflux pump subunit AcrA (membrane-fusion protein)
VAVRTPSLTAALSAAGVVYDELRPIEVRMEEAFINLVQRQAALAAEQPQSTLINAQNVLQKLIDGPKATDIAMVQGQVLQAQIAQLLAENNLDNAQLVAPQDGIISQINLRRGELTSSAHPAIILTDLYNLELKLWVDELDMRQLDVGQPAHMTVEAVPGLQLAGNVTEISTTARKIIGVIAYEITIVPTTRDNRIRAGMSATATITTGQVADSVIAPNRFIQIDLVLGPLLHNMLIGSLLSTTYNTQKLPERILDAVLQGIGMPANGAHNQASST